MTKNQKIAKTIKSNYCMCLSVVLWASGIWICNKDIICIYFLLPSCQQENYVIITEIFT